MSLGEAAAYAIDRLEIDKAGDIVDDCIERVKAKVAEDAELPAAMFDILVELDLLSVPIDWQALLEYLIEKSKELRELDALVPQIYAAT